jgi:hypothetical protein
MSFAPPLRITGFAGLVPRLGRRHLAPGQAQIAFNCKLTSGDLFAFRSPLITFNPQRSATILTI